MWGVYSTNLKYYWPVRASGRYWSTIISAGRRIRMGQRDDDLVIKFVSRGMSVIDYVKESTLKNSQKIYLLKIV